MKKIIIMLAIFLFTAFLCISSLSASENLNLDNYVEYNNPDCRILEKDEKYTVIKDVKTGKIKIVYLENNSEITDKLKNKYPHASFEFLNSKFLKTNNIDKKSAPFYPRNSAYDVMVTGNLGTKAGETLAKGLAEWIKNWFNRPLEYHYKKEASILLDSTYRMVKPYTLNNGWHKFFYGKESYWVFVKDNRLLVGWNYDKYYNGWYFFFPNGIMMNGNGYSWIKHNYKWYEFQDGGKLIEHSGWEKYGNHWMYYIPGDFGAVTRWNKINDKWYYFDDNGYLEE